VRSVAEGLFGERRAGDEPAVFHAIDFASRSRFVVGLMKIVGGVDVHDAGLDGFRVGGGS